MPEDVLGPSSSSQPRGRWLRLRPVWQPHAPQHDETWTSTYRARQFLFQIPLYTTSALGLGHGAAYTDWLSKVFQLKSPRQLVAT